MRGGREESIVEVIVGGRFVCEACFVAWKREVRVESEGLLGETCDTQLAVGD